MKNPIIVETFINAPVSIVWEAITDNRHMKQWYFDIPGFKAQIGYEFSFYGGTENRRYLHLCKITESERMKMLSYTWRYGGYPGVSIVKFELEPHNEKTRVVLTHENVDAFPTDNKDFAMQNFIDGWNHIVKISLKEYAERM